MVATADGSVVIASDALHYYEELERDRAFAVVTDLPQMYRAYDQLKEVASHAGTEIVAGHDPAVFTRFPGHDSGSHVARIGALAS